MSGRRRTTRRRSLGPWAVTALAVAVLLVVTSAGPASSGTGTGAPDGPAATNRAVVVIDSGTTRTATCVRFDEPEISGLDALRRSGATVVHATFGSMGAAICSINGMGCPLTGCLTCQAPAYWNYFRAVGGAPFARSGAGATTTKVRDGDVEGWSWGANPSAPPRPTVDAVCGARPAPPAPPPVAPPTPSPAAPSPAAPSPGVGGGAGPVPGGSTPDGESTTDTTGASGDRDGQATTTTDDTETTDETTDPLEDLEIVDAAAMAAADDTDGTGGGGPSWPSIVGFTLLLAGLTTWGVVVRRRRLGSS